MQEMLGQHDMLFFYYIHILIL